MGNINIDALIEAASKKLGIPPEQLRKSLNTGNIGDITSRMSKSDRDKINSVMNNSELMEKMRRKYMGNGSQR